MFLDLRAHAKPAALLLAFVLGFGGWLRAADSSPGDDAERRRLVVGIWEDDYQGHRTMTVRPDGTATMVVELHGVKAALYASRLVFEMTWSLEQGRLKKRTVSGEPPKRVKAILKLMGDRVDEKILELNHDELVLLDQDGKRQYYWRRVKSGSSGKG
jgi:hypothetical protein